MGCCCFCPSCPVWGYVCTTTRLLKLRTIVLFLQSLLPLLILLRLASQHLPWWIYAVVCGIFRLPCPRVSSRNWDNWSVFTKRQLKEATSKFCSYFFVQILRTRCPQLYRRLTDCDHIAITVRNIYCMPRKNLDIDFEIILSDLWTDQ